MDQFARSLLKMAVRHLGGSRKTHICGNLCWVRDGLMPNTVSRCWGDVGEIGCFGGIGGGLFGVFLFANASLNSVSTLVLTPAHFVDRCRSTSGCVWIYWRNLSKWFWNRWISPIVKHYTKSWSVSKSLGSSCWNYQELSSGCRGR